MLALLPLVFFLRQPAQARGERRARIEVEVG